MPTLGDLIDPEREAQLRALLGQTKADPSPPTVPVEVPATDVVEVEVDPAAAELIDTDEQDGLDELAQAEADSEGKGSRASLNRSPKKNWVENAGELPGYIREVARAIEREQGLPLSRAIPIAIGRIKRWARGEGDVKADTRAKAAAAVAAWEALKARSGKAADLPDVEVKGPEADVDGMEHKSGGAGTALLDTDDETGTVVALVSATNIEDRVGDIIAPGAYKQTLLETEPIGVWSHDDKVWVARAEQVTELLPGDPELKGLRMNNGQPWPDKAGALKVKARFNLDTPHGAAAYSDVKFFKGKTGWSIGYRVAPGTRRDPATGKRTIKSLQLFEFSPVMVGAAPQAMTLSVKSLAGAHTVDPDEVPEPLQLADADEVKAMLAARNDLEVKARRVVRTAAGASQYNQPIGSIITPDSDERARRGRAAARDRQGDADTDRMIDERAKLIALNKRRKARGLPPLLKLPAEAKAIDLDEVSDIELELLDDDLDESEVKARRVRTAAGAAKYGQPIGSLITRSPDTWRPGASGLPTAKLRSGAELRYTSRSGQQPAVGVIGADGKTAGRASQVIMGNNKGKWIVTDARGGRISEDTADLNAVIDKLGVGTSAAPVAPAARKAPAGTYRSHTGAAMTVHADGTASLQKQGTRTVTPVKAEDVIPIMRGNNFVAAPGDPAVGSPAGTKPEDRPDVGGNDDINNGPNPDGLPTSARKPAEYLSEHVPGWDTPGSGSAADFVEVAAWSVETAAQEAYRDAGGKGKMPAAARRAIEAELNPYDEDRGFRLATRMSDDYDFTEVSRESVQEAIKIAIRAGKRGRKNDELDDLEVKAGRMLSQGNITRVMQAYEQLGTLLRAAGVLDPDSDDDAPKGYGPQAWASEALDLAERMKVAGDEVGVKAALELADTQLELLGLVERKRDYSSDARDSMAGGAAMGDGSFPIKNATDLHNAIRAVGRAKDPAAAKAHIRKRAKALGLLDELPDGWKADDEAVEDISELLMRGAELKSLVTEPPPFG